MPHIVLLPTFIRRKMESNGRNSGCIERISRAAWTVEWDVTESGLYELKISRFKPSEIRVTICVT